MKTRQFLLGVMVMSAMLSAYADDNNDPNQPHPRGQQRSDQANHATIVVQPAASRAQVSAAMGARSTFAPPLPLPTQQVSQQAVQHATQQAQISNRPVASGSWQGRPQAPAPTFSQGGFDNNNQIGRQPFNRQGNTQGSASDVNVQGQRDERGHDMRDAAAGAAGAGVSHVPSWQRNQQNTRTGWNPNIGPEVSYRQGNHLYNDNAVQWSNDSQGHPVRSVPDRNWQNHYRMPLADGNSQHYAVRYHRGWHPGYDWHEHGWRADYQSVDPYWFAVITSMAYAQSWSDDELSQAINDDNLRLQLLYDANVRQQMVDSGFPVDQVDYPPQVMAGDPSYDPNYDQGYYQGYNQRAEPGVGYDPNRDPAYDPNYDPRSDPNYVPSSAPVYVTERVYRTPAAPASLNPYSPNSPSPDNGSNNTNRSVTSGDQVANRNANKNVQFFCNAKNRAETARAFKQVQSMDLSVWPDIESYNTCRIWSGAK